jgi:hypothetical protein
VNSHRQRVRKKYIGGGRRVADYREKCGGGDREKKIQLR